MDEPIEEEERAQVEMDVGRQRLRTAREQRPVACGAAAFGGVTLYDGGRYVSDTTLWAPEVTHQPACREGQFYLGEAEREAHRCESAASRYEAALAPRSGVLAYVDRGAALQNLGVVRLEQRRFGDARRAFRAALLAPSPSTAPRS